MNRPSQPYVRILLVMCLGLGLILSAPRVAWAATITVTTTADELNADGDCSLREAISAANNDSTVDACAAGNGADTVTLPAGTYMYSTAAEVSITDDLTLTGAGPLSTVIDANGLARALVVSSSVVTISQLTIRRGNSIAAGNDVYVGPGANLTLRSVRLSDVPSGGSMALFVFNGATATVLDSRVSGNLSGGVVTQTGAVLNMRNSSITDNVGTSGGGLNNDGTATLTNVTVSGNQSVATGGGILTSGTLQLSNVTIANNVAGAGAAFGQGGGLHVNAGTATARNTLIADNVDLVGTPTNDCLGTITGAGYNLIEDMSGCAFTGDTTGNQTGVAPLLGALGNNGGGTFTQALLVGSPAIQGGNPGGCVDDLGAALTTDQRGYVRPVDSSGVPGSICDIGAYEYASPGTPVPTATSTATQTLVPTATWTATPTRTATATRTNTPPATTTATLTRTSTASPTGLVSTPTGTPSTAPTVTSTATSVVILTQPATPTPGACGQSCVYLPEIQQDSPPPPAGEAGSSVRLRG